jgi:osmoprotectant transport system ATP-binding protein
MYRGRYPRELSGGQQQRVGFARALAAGPQVMLLDEPFGALDPVTRDELRGEFRQIQKKLGLTAVMVTHDMTEALLSADLIAVMNAGRLVRLGTPRELLHNPGDDFVAALLAAPKRQAAELEALVAEPAPAETRQLVTRSPEDGKAGRPMREEGIYGRAMD